MEQGGGLRQVGVAQAGLEFVGVLGGLARMRGVIRCEQGAGEGDVGLGLAVGVLDGGVECAGNGTGKVWRRRDRRRIGSVRARRRA